MSAYYPTGDTLIDELCEFLGARLATIFGAPTQVKLPCLAENWWVDEVLSTSSICFPLAKYDRETGLRICWRWARNRNVENALAGRLCLENGSADLLLHQMSALMPALFLAAQSVHQQQFRIAA